MRTAAGAGAGATPTATAEGVTSTIARILWLSRHAPLPAEERALRELYGPDAVLIRDQDAFSGAEDIVRRFRSGGFVDLMIIAPLSVVQQVVDRGLRPLWAQTQQLDPGSGEAYDFISKGVQYRFVELRRVRRLALEFDDPKIVGPDGEPRGDLTRGDSPG